VTRSPQVVRAFRSGTEPPAGHQPTYDGTFASIDSAVRADTLSDIAMLDWIDAQAGGEA